jgi:hypothetical protein
MATKASKSSTKKPASKKTPAKKSGSSQSGSAKSSSGKSSAKGAPVANDPKLRQPAPAAQPGRPAFVSRAVVHLGDDDELITHGGGGAGYGRCGGRLLSSKIEQSICHRLGLAGVVHSHSPRHYEVRFEDGKVAAYAPMIVLRGRGREGKSVVIEAVEDPNAPILRKVIAFRAQYGQEFYIIFVANDDVLDAVPLAAYDESCAETNVNTLVARLAE